MANWALLCRDATFGRVKSTEVSCTKNANYAANVVDQTPSSVWRPADTGTNLFGFLLGSSIVAKGVAICNHSMSGETITLKTAATLLGAGTSRGSWTIPSNEDCVFVIASPSVSSLIWQVEISGSTTAKHIGHISILDDDYYFETGYPSAPRFPIQVSAEPGAAILRSAANVPYEQTMGGVMQPFGLNLGVLDYSVDTPGIGRKIHNWYAEGGSHRLWVTDDTFGSSATGVGRGYYCFAPSLQGQIMYPTARGEMVLPLERIAYDRQV